jgi:hypothetical protein
VNLALCGHTAPPNLRGGAMTTMPAITHSHHRQRSRCQRSRYPGSWDPNQCSTRTPGRSARRNPCRRHLLGLHGST